MKSFFNLREKSLSESKTEEADYPHMMYHPETGKAVEVKTPEEHDKYAKKGYTHEEPEDDLDEAFGQYTPHAEKSKFNSGYRAHLKNPQGKTSYLSQHSFKKKSDAVAHAKAYHDHVNVQKRDPDRFSKPDRSKLVESTIAEDAWEEIPMMKRQLKFIAYAAEEIAEYLDLGVDPEEWYQNKLAQVHLQMQTLYAYMEGDEDQDDYDDEDDMMDEQDKAHPYLHGGKHSKNVSFMGWPTKDVDIRQGAGRHKIKVHQYTESAKYVSEELSVTDGVGAWIDDFKKSDAPQFKGKSDKERRDMALAAYLSAKEKMKKD